MFGIPGRATNFLLQEVFATGNYKLMRSLYKKKDWKEVKMSEIRSRPDPVIMKLDTPEFRSIFTEELQVIIDLFKKYSYELRIAGGAVRDLLIGKQPTDLDFATDATPQQMKKMFNTEEIRMINDNGENHGTITARINNKENFEITTLRIDVLTNGRHAEIQFTKDWQLDANRRDLTINSMYLDLNGKVYDYFYGYDDLQNRKVIFVGDPNCRIQEDYLRILRYFRFYGKIVDNPDHHDEATIQAIKDNIDGLSCISGERIWSEWQKILSGNFGLELMLKLLECGSSMYLGLPEKPNVKNFETVYQRALSNSVTLRPISLITSMLEDNLEVMNLHSRLKLSKADRDLALFLILHKKCKPCEKPLKPYQKLVFTQQPNKYNLYQEYVKELLRYNGAMELLNEFKQWQIPQFPFGGNVLKEYVANPTMIGNVINELKEIWFEEDFKLTKEQLLEHVPNIVSKLGERRIKRKL